MTTSGGAYGICISCDAKFAGDQATIDRCKAEAGWGFEHHGYHYDNTCQIHHPVDSGDPCSHLCTESCSVCEAPCMAGGLASEECKACAETTNCEACISCHMYASLFKANSTDFTNGTNFTMPDCGQCIDASSECGECMRRCGSCIGNNDPFALNSDGEPCAACDACTQWIPCAFSSGPAPGDNARNEMKFCTQDNTPVYARVSRLFFFFCLSCDIDFSSLSLSLLSLLPVLSPPPDNNNFISSSSSTTTTTISVQDSARQTLQCQDLAKETALTKSKTHVKNSRGLQATCHTWLFAREADTTRFTISRPDVPAQVVM